METYPQKAHPRLSTDRVLYVRWLRWLDKASANQIKKAVIRTLWTVLLALIVFQSQFLLGFLLGVFKWNGYRLTLFVTLLVLTSRYKQFQSLWKKAWSGNQHTFEGIPRDELITYLFKTGHFKREQTMSHFCLSQPRYTKIAKKLEKNDILIRGESNALVLNPKISREELGTQLRDNFPLRFNHEKGIWSGTDSQFYRSETKRDNELRETEHKFSWANRKLRKKLALKEREEAEEALSHSPFVIRELAAV